MDATSTELGGTDHEVATRVEATTRSEEVDDTAAPRSPRLLLLGLDLLPWSVLALAILWVAWVMVRGHWMPIGDEAMITAYSTDVGTSQTPTLGMPTSLSLRVGAPVRHPGPIQFWLLSIPGRLLGSPGYGIALGTATITLACIGVAAASARHLRTRAAQAIVAIVAAAVTINGIGHAGTVGPFNTYLVVPAGFAALVALWALLDGHHWSLAAFVAAGSIAGQVHVTGLPMVGALAVLAAGVVTYEVVRRPREDPTRRRLVTRIIPVSVGLGLLLWSGPIYDQLFGTGNLITLATSGSDLPGAGFGFAFDRTASLLAIRPAWTTSSINAVAEPTSAQRVALAALIVVLLGGLGWGISRRNRHLVACSTVATVSMATALFVTSRLPSDARALASPSNRLLWWPIGGFVWVVAIMAIASILREPIARGRAARTGPPRWVAPVLASVATLVVVVPFAGNVHPEQAYGSILWGPVRQHTAAIERRAPEGSVVRLKVPGTDINNLTMTQSLTGQLRLDGYEVQLDVDDPWDFFRAYQRAHPSDARPDVIVYLSVTPDAPAPPPGSELLSSWDPARPSPPFEGFVKPAVFGGGRYVSRLYLVPVDGPGATPYEP